MTRSSMRPARSADQGSTALLPEDFQATDSLAYEVTEDGVGSQVRGAADDGQPGVSDAEGASDTELRHRAQTSKKTVSRSPCSQMSNLSSPSGSGTAMRVARRAGSLIEHSTGSTALAVCSSGKYSLVTTRSSRPRANTDTSRCGASMPPSEVGSGPGLRVTMRYDPSGAVGHRPKPRNPW